MALLGHYCMHHLRLHLTVIQWLKIACGLGIWLCFNCIGYSSVKILSVLMNTEANYKPGHAILKGG